MVASDVAIMAILVSMLLLFMVVVGVVIIHVCLTARSARRGIGMDTDLPSERSSSSRVIRRRLSQADLDKLPCYEYRSSKNITNVEFAEADCAVCLESFKTGERCRVLPVCKHSFHAQCVDGWLLKIPICPICRGNISDSSSSMMVMVPGESSSSRSRSVNFSEDTSFEMRDRSFATTTQGSSSRFSDVGGLGSRSFMMGSENVIIEMVDSPDRDVDDVMSDSISGPPASVDSFPLYI
ncbi:RING-H2 finger protein ATL56 [Linum perenne]